jgi:uncharacterized protein YbaA (DUF1428 family)
MKTINVQTIPTFQEYGVKTAVEKLSSWFTDNGYTTEIKTAPSGNNTLKVVGLDWHQYAFRGDTDPVNGLLEPWDEQTMIFVSQ